MTLNVESLPQSNPKPLSEAHLLNQNTKNYCNLYCKHHRPEVWKRSQDSSLLFGGYLLHDFIDMHHFPQFTFRYVY